MTLPRKLSEIAYSSNTCAKYALPGYKFVVFLEHVCKILVSWLRIYYISRTRVQNAGGKTAGQAARQTDPGSRHEKFWFEETFV